MNARRSLPHRAAPATFVWLAAAAATLAGCVTTEPALVPPHVNLSPEAVDLSGGAAAPGVDLGMEVEANESDSLENLEVLPGVRVRRVSPAGPAAAAGLQAGDVVLSIDGVHTDDVDAVKSLARHAGEARTFVIEARRDTTVFKANVLAQPRAIAAPPVELYRVDPLKTRAGYVTVPGGGAHMAARIARLDPDGPLADAGLAEGDVLLDLDGEPFASAQTLVRRLLEEREFGERVTFRVLRADGSVDDVRVRLWSPGRRLTELAVLPLFSYESTLDPSRTEFSFIDLWLFSLFSYKREAGEREYRILSLIRFSSGYGELIEEAEGGAGS